MMSTMQSSMADGLVEDRFPTCTYPRDDLDEPQVRLDGHAILIATVSDVTDMSPGGSVAALAHWHSHFFASLRPILILTKKNKSHMTEVIDNADYFECRRSQPWIELPTYATNAPNELVESSFEVWNLWQDLLRNGMKNLILQVWSLYIVVRQLLT